jgi:hypothetical protein
MSEIIDSIHRMRSPKKLLQTFEAIKIRLEHLGVSSNQTDPVGQYAEYLVSKLYSANKTTNGTAGCDLLTPEGFKVEVKGRVSRKEGYIPKTDIKDSNVSGGHFDYLVYIVFDADYNIERAYGMTVNTFKDVSDYVEHNNSAPKWIFKAKPELLSHQDIDDLTNTIAEWQ